MLLLGEALKIGFKPANLSLVSMLRGVLGIFLCCKSALQRAGFGLFAVKLGLEFVPYPSFDCSKV